jgi:hypothetical protein
MKNRKIKFFMNFLGGILALMSILFIGERFSKYWVKIPDDTFSTRMIISIGVLSLIYCGANLLLSLAWKRLMINFGQEITSRMAIKIYGITQLGKYIPGNVFQFAGRQVVAMSYGFSTLAIAKSTLFELLFLFITGAAFIFLPIHALNMDLNFIFILVVFFVYLIFIFSIFHKSKVKYWYAIFIYYTAFLFISGVVYLCILHLISGYFELSIHVVPLIICAAISSWLAGFITPGAPAGMGIREVVLLLLLNPFFSEANIVLAIVIWRIVTIAGDSIFYVLSVLIKKEIHYD